MIARHACALTLLSFGLCACQPPQPQMTAQEADIAVRSLLAAEDSLMVTKDLDGFMRLLADDAVFMPPGEASLEGREAIRAAYADIFRAYDVQLRHEPGPVELRGSLIVNRGNARGVIRPVAGGDSVVLDNKYLFVLQIADDRSLRHWRAIFNANPVAPGH